MRVLVVEPHSDGLLDLALRAKEHGHECRYYCKDYDPIKNPVGRGLVERVPDWRGSMNWADLVLLGSNGYCMAEMERWHRDRGVPVIGIGSEAAAWELDRLAGMAAFKRAGIPVPPFRHVSSYDEAIAYALKRDEGLAIKPSGDVTDKSLSFVAKSAREAVWRLQRWKKEGKAFPQGFILQDRIEGVEMAVGAWIGPSGFAAGWEENFEEKRLFAGGVGPNCGEAGTVMRLVRTSKIANKVLQPLEERLVALGYVGNVDVNCIVDDDGTPWPLEFTMRFGYPAINIELALHHGDPIEFLAGVASGKPPSTRTLNEVAVGVVCAIPPYPFGHERTEEVVNVPIWGVTPVVEDRLHYCNVALDKNPEQTLLVAEGKGGSNLGNSRHLVTSGSYVMVATGTGESVVAARSKAYRALDRLTIPASPFWRIDVGSRLRSGLDAVQAHGFAAGMRYA